MSETNGFGPTVKAFRAKVGFTAQAVRAQDSAQTETLNLELAEKTGSGYDWENKITVQVSRVELPRFCAVVLGLIRQTEGKYHGDSKNKSWHLMWPPGGDSGLALKLSDAGLYRNINFNADEVFWLGSLAVDQLGKNTGAATQSDTLNILRLSFRAMA